MPENENTVHAEPQKEFFIDMLTRDIHLPDCILDLIDNSVHSLIRTQKLSVMKIITGRSDVASLRQAKIELSFSDSHFSILDNCGGVTRKDAQEEVFLFGKRRKERGHPGLGLYGVGMKRAFFKLGRKIEFISRTN